MTNSENAQLSTDGRSWVPITTALPPYDQDVLLTVRWNASRDTVAPGTRRSTDADGEHYWFSSGKEVDNEKWEVIAWMPFPETYRG